MSLYRKVKAQRSEIGSIYTDGNSCYGLAFKRNAVKEQHVVTKAQTHLIESFNSSMRDNMARFNRRTKRYSKTLEMLCITLDLFFFYKRFKPRSFFSAV